MTEEIKIYLGTFLPLKNEELDIFIRKFRPLHLKKGDYFIREGKLCAEIGLILKGCLVCVYNKEGMDVIDEFSMENEFISDYPNFLDNKPSDKNVKCLEDTELLVINNRDLNDLYNQSQSFERVGRIIAETLFKSWHQKAKSLMLDDAETRYNNLIKYRPTLPQRVPQYLIASYLGITAESLSRIRKKIKP